LLSQLSTVRLGLLLLLLLDLERTFTSLDLGFTGFQSWSGLSLGSTTLGLLLLDG
jgi:hypothetical protein